MYEEDSIMTAVSTAERITSRPVQTDDDWWRVRHLLIDTYPITPVDFNWEIRRWDGWRNHRADDSEYQQRREKIRLWETDGGRLVGAAHPEGSGDLHLQIHPDYRHLEDEMIAWGEEHLAVPADEGQQRRLDIFVFEYDYPRQCVLMARGYEKMPRGGVSRRLRFGNWPLPTPVIADGYTMRTTTSCLDDGQRIADILNAAFNRTFHTGAEVEHFMTTSPSFRHDLDLAAIAPDGSFASYVGLTYEPTNRYGIFEPVCTHPDHVRKGLAQALMFEGLHRLKALGAVNAYVGTGDAVPANRLYDSIGFAEAYKGYVWRKVF
jgi:GNAT superfamily N-acetyltransferase